jgi:hypothetical protein
MYIGLHVKYRYYCQILMKLEFSRQNFIKFLNTTFHENPSSGSRVVPYRRTDGQTDMTKLIIAFRNFAKAHKKVLNFY